MMIDDNDDYSMIINDHDDYDEDDKDNYNQNDKTVRNLHNTLGTAWHQWVM